VARPRLTPTVLLIAASIGTVVVLAAAAACSTPTAQMPPPPVGDTGPRPGSGEPSAATIECPRLTCTVSPAEKSWSGFSVTVWLPLSVALRDRGGGGGTAMWRPLNVSWPFASDSVVASAFAS